MKLFMIEQTLKLANAQCFVLFLFVFFCFALFFVFCFSHHVSVSGYA